MKSIIFLFVIVLVLLTGLPAESTVGLKMLSAEAGARAVGMGGAFSAVPGDPYSAAYNPAATWGVEGISGSFGYNTYWENTRIETGYISFFKRAAVITAGVQFAAVDDMEGRTAFTEDFYPFSAHDISFKLGASFELDKNYYLGFSLGWIMEKIDQYDGSAVNFDMGLLVQPRENLNIGFAVVNFGGTVKLLSESVDLPTTYRGGVSYAYRQFNTAADLAMLDGDIYVHFGEEFTLKDMLFIRAGYRFGYDTKDFSAGLGFSKRNFRIDYAFLPFGGGLSDSHLFNLTFDF
ncbi:MAG: PorV/PorQ family protein [Candidatus Zixiibacteriota bacterium]|nr:MAG: PorV/PorQ family protein [candidate division Zixibacteria bacterium]